MLVDIWEGTEPRPEVERFCDMWGIKGPILLDPAGELAATLGVRGVPTNVVVDSDGTIRAFVQASADLRDVSAAMEVQVADACTRMGLDLGIQPAQMAPQHLAAEPAL